jgi:hypothetical protein
MKKQLSISRLSFLQKRYKEVLKPVEFGNLLQADPSQNKKYMDWIAIQFLQESIDLNSLTIKKVNAFLSFYDRKKVKNALPRTQRDIHFFKTYQKLEETLVPMLGEEQFFTTKELKSKALLDEFKNFNAYNLTTFEESRILGKGTPWCTSINEDEFEEYTEKSKLIMFESKYDAKFRFLFDSKTLEFRDQGGKDLNLNLFFAANMDIHFYLNRKFRGFLKKVVTNKVLVTYSFESYIENHPEMYR